MQPPARFARPMTNNAFALKMRSPLAFCEIFIHIARTFYALMPLTTLGPDKFYLFGSFTRKHHSTLVKVHTVYVSQACVPNHVLPGTTVKLIIIYGLLTHNDMH